MRMIRCGNPACGRGHGNAKSLLFYSTATVGRIEVICKRCTARNLLAFYGDRVEVEGVRTRGDR